jgi:hypothetical protein
MDILSMGQEEMPNSAMVKGGIAKDKRAMYWFRGRGPDDLDGARVEVWKCGWIPRSSDEAHIAVFK